MTYTFIGLAIFGACAALVHYLASKAPLIEPCDEIERVERLIGMAKHHREQMDAIADEFVSMHGPTSDYEIDELMRVVHDGESYNETIKRIMQHRNKVA